MKNHTRKNKKTKKIKGGSNLGRFFINDKGELIDRRTGILANRNNDDVERELIAEGWGGGGGGGGSKSKRYTVASAGSAKAAKLAKGKRANASIESENNAEISQSIFEGIQSYIKEQEKLIPPKLRRGLSIGNNQTYMEGVFLREKEKLMVETFIHTEINDEDELELYVKQCKNAGAFFGFTINKDFVVACEYVGSKLGRLNCEPEKPIPTNFETEARAELKNQPENSSKIEKIAKLTVEKQRIQLDAENTLRAINSVTKNGIKEDDPRRREEILARALVFKNKRENPRHNIKQNANISILAAFPRYITEFSIYLDKRAPFLGRGEFKTEYFAEINVLAPEVGSKPKRSREAKGAAASVDGAFKNEVGGSFSTMGSNADYGDDRSKQNIGLAMHSHFSSEVTESLYGVTYTIDSRGSKNCVELVVCQKKTPEGDVYYEYGENQANNPTEASHWENQAAKMRVANDAITNTIRSITDTTPQVLMGVAVCLRSQETFQAEKTVNGSTHEAQSLLPNQLLHKRCFAIGSSIPIDSHINTAFLVRVVGFTVLKHYIKCIDDKLNHHSGVMENTGDYKQEDIDGYNGRVRLLLDRRSRLKVMLIDQERVWLTSNMGVFLNHPSRTNSRVCAAVEYAHWYHDGLQHISSELYDYKKEEIHSLDALLNFEIEKPKKVVKKMEPTPFDAAQYTLEKQTKHSIMFYAWAIYSGYSKIEPTKSLLAKLLIAISKDIQDIAKKHMLQSKSEPIAEIHQKILLTQFPSTVQVDKEYLKQLAIAMPYTGTLTPEKLNTAVRYLVGYSLNELIRKPPQGMPPIQVTELFPEVEIEPIEPIPSVISGTEFASRGLAGSRNISGL